MKRSEPDSELAQRHLVHRDNDDQVLVFEPVQLNERQYRSRVANASKNPYYSDHTHTYKLDILYWAEACRQAGMGGGNKFKWPNHDMFFFVNKMDIRVIENPLMFSLTSEADITTTLNECRMRSDGTPRRVHLAQTASDRAGTTLLVASMSVQGVPREEYRLFREFQRNGRPAPSLVVLAGAPRLDLTQSVGEMVDRTQAKNIVISDISIGESTATARLSPDPRNHEIFDHDYDHYPAMVLLEGARQLAIAFDRRSKRPPIVSYMSADFLSFVELDMETKLEWKAKDENTGEISIKQAEEVKSVVQLDITHVA